MSKERTQRLMSAKAMLQKIQLGMNAAAARNNEPTSGTVEWGRAMPRQRLRRLATTLMAFRMMISAPNEARTTDAIERNVVMFRASCAFVYRIRAETPNR